MRLPSGCRSVSGNIVRLRKPLYGLRQPTRQFHKRLESKFVKIGSEMSLLTSV